MVFRFARVALTSDILTRLRHEAQSAKSPFLDEIIEEIIQLQAAAATAQRAAEQWRARAERAEHELHQYRRHDPRWARWRPRPIRRAAART